jgi:catechol 2,3-dioxygenase-like lactoylglutathione lyase family enzyme
VPAAIHHTVVIVRDLDASLRFYRDGLGLDLLQDRRLKVTGRPCWALGAAAFARFASAMREFPTTTRESWSSTPSKATSPKDRRRPHRGLSFC